MDEKRLLEWKPRMGILTVNEKIEQGNLLKDQANLYVKKGNFKKALTIYAKVFAYVNGISVGGDALSSYAQHVSNMSANEDENCRIMLLKISVWSNMSLCHLKIGNPEKAVELSEKVLSEDPTHRKALYRKSQALVQLKKYEKAKSLLIKLLDEQPNDLIVRNELKKLNEQMKEYISEAKAKSNFNNIFNKPGGVGLY